MCLLTPMSLGGGADGGRSPVGSPWHVAAIVAQGREVAAARVGAQRRGESWRVD